MNYTTQIEQSLEVNPHPEPGFLFMQFLCLSKIYLNEEHLGSQLTIVESQIDWLGSSFIWHAREMHPYGDPHYQVDSQLYYGDRMKGSYLLRWQCLICNYIFKVA